MRYSLSGSTGLTWTQIRDAVQLGEKLGFDTFYAADHLMAVAGFDEDAGLLDAVSLLLALAPVTTTLRLGAMVSPITIRHPVVLAARHADARPHQRRPRRSGGRRGLVAVRT